MRKREELIRLTQLLHRRAYNLTDNGSASLLDVAEMAGLLEQCRVLVKSLARLEVDRG